MATTVVLGYQIQGVPVLANPSDYTFSIPAVAANVGTALQRSTSNAAFASDAENDSVVVEAVRLWCNFADGFVFNTLTKSPLISYWQGDDTLPPVGSYLDTTFRTLNEWLPVNMVLPRDPATVGAYGGLSCLPFGDLSFYTKSIASAYVGAQPIFEIQWIIRGGIW